MSPRKRVITRILIFLLLGAIMNVAVAWGCAIWIDPTDDWYPARLWGGELGEMDWLLKQRGVSKPYKDWNVQLHQARGALRAISSWRDADTKIGGFSGMVPMGPAEPLVPHWASFIGPPTKPQTSGMVHTRAVEGWGWPLISSYTIWSADGTFPGNYPTHLVYGITLPPAPRNGMFGPYQAQRALPVLPVVTGFAINTIFYAAVLWMLFAFPFALRRRRRIKRGLCPACAYPVGASPVCTECGKPVRQQSAISGQQLAEVQS